MTTVTRRRFLLGLLVGAGAAGAAAWLGRDEAEPVAATSTTSGATTTASPIATPASTTTVTTAPQPTATTTPTTTAATTTSEPAVISIPVICRQAWGAREPSGEFTKHQIGQITVHHTAVFLEDNADAPGRARQHQVYHQSLGWPDLAYHYLIDARGNVYEGRPIDTVGDTATDYDPTGHLLVCCEGNFDEQLVPEEQYQTLVTLVAHGCRQFEVAPAAVRGHRDLATTSCPGDDLYARIADGTLAGDVAAKGDREHRVESLCGSQGHARVAEIEAGG